MWDELESTGTAETLLLEGDAPTKLDAANPPLAAEGYKFIN